MKIYYYYCPQNIEEYDKFMKYCELMGIKWASGHAPRDACKFSTELPIVYIIGSRATEKTLTYIVSPPSMLEDAPNFRDLDLVSALKLNKPLCIKKPQKD